MFLDDFLFLSSFFSSQSLLLDKAFRRKDAWLAESSASADGGGRRQQGSEDADRDADGPEPDECARRDTRHDVARGAAPSTSDRNRPAAATQVGPARWVPRAATIVRSASPRSRLCAEEKKDEGGKKRKSSRNMS